MANPENKGKSWYNNSLEAKNLIEELEKEKKDLQKRWKGKRGEESESIAREIFLLISEINNAKEVFEKLTQGEDKNEPSRIKTKDVKQETETDLSLKENLKGSENQVSVKELMQKVDDALKLQEAVETVEDVYAVEDEKIFQEINALRQELGINPIESVDKINATDRAFYELIKTHKDKEEKLKEVKENYKGIKVVVPETPQTSPTPEPIAPGAETSPEATMPPVAEPKPTTEPAEPSTEPVEPMPAEARDGGEPPVDGPPPPPEGRRGGEDASDGDENFEKGLREIEDEYDEAINHLRQEIIDLIERARKYDEALGRDKEKTKELIDNSEAVAEINNKIDRLKEKVEEETNFDTIKRLRIEVLEKLLELEKEKTSLVKLGKKLEREELIEKIVEKVIGKPAEVVGETGKIAGKISGKAALYGLTWGAVFTGLLVKNSFKLAWAELKLIWETVSGYIPGGKNFSRGWDLGRKTFTDKEKKDKG